MGMHFRAAASQRLTRAATVTAYPMTFWWRFKANDVTGVYSMVTHLRTAGSVIDDYFTSYCNAGVISGEVAASDSYSGLCTSTTRYVAGEIQTGCVVHASATSRAAFCNGEGKGTETANLTPSAGNISTLQINGFNSDSFSGGYFDGTIYEVAIWNVALADWEVRALETVSPTRIQPGNLQGYYTDTPVAASLLFDMNPRTSNHLVATNSPTPLPTRTLGRRRHAYVFEDAGGGGGFQSAWAHGSNVVLGMYP